MLERGIFTTFVTSSSFTRSCQVCHSRGLDTTDVDPEALVRWLADWVELSDAAGGKIWEMALFSWQAKYNLSSVKGAIFLVYTILLTFAELVSHLMTCFFVLALVTCFLSALAGSRSTGHYSQFRTQLALIQSALHYNGTKISVCSSCATSTFTQSRAQPALL